MNISRVRLRKSIKSLYTLNLLEGEGVGTAYEYFTKLRKLEKFINSVGRPKNILVAGLPEKYGLSMDFFLLAHVLRAEMVVVDQRHKRLARASKVFSTLKSSQHLNGAKVNFIRVENLLGLSSHFLQKEFDLALSSEVLQCLDGNQGAYIASLKEIASNFAVFAPNRANKSHIKFSRLHALYLQELLQHCRGEGVEVNDFGYVDMPPFPPGLSRSQQKREQAAASQFETLLMKGLEIYGLCEDFFPQPLKERTAHIVYVIAKCL